MRKMMKSIVCLAVAVALVLSLAACGKDSKSSEDATKETSKSSEDVTKEDSKSTEDVTNEDPNTPEGVVKRAFDARLNCDAVTLEKCYEEPDERVEELAKDNVNSIRAYYDWYIDKDYWEDIENQWGEKAFKAYIDASIEIDKAYNKRCKTEIDKVKKDGNEAEVKYTTYEPELEKSKDELMDEAVKNVDLEDEYLEVKLDEKGWEKIIKEWKKLSLEQIEEADLEEYGDVIYVVKDNGTWKIAKDQSPDED